MRDFNMLHLTLTKLPPHLTSFQGFSDIGRAVRCRWCCLPLWFGSGMACLSLHPPTMSRTKSFRKPRGTSRASQRNSASSRTAAHSSLDHIMSSRSRGIFIILNVWLFQPCETITGYTGFWDLFLINMNNTFLKNLLYSVWVCLLMWEGMVLIIFQHWKPNKDAAAVTSHTSESVFVPDTKRNKKAVKKKKKKMLSANFIWSNTPKMPCVSVTLHV